MVVSHDRGFVRRVATKIMEVAEGRVHLYPGTYDEYVWSLQKSLAAEAESESAPAKRAEKDTVPAGVLKKERDRQVRAIERKIADCEQTIQELEKAVAAANEKISAGDVDPELLKKIAADSQKLQEVEADWLSLANELEKLQ